MQTKPNLPDTSEWAPETLEWYRVWKDSSRTDEWDDAQWQFMFDTAVVHSLIYGAGNFALLGELRNRLAYMGLTFEEKKQEKQPLRITALDELKKHYDTGVARRKSGA